MGHGGRPIQSEAMQHTCPCMQRAASSAPNRCHRAPRVIGPRPDRDRGHPALILPAIPRLSPLVPRPLVPRCQKLFPHPPRPPRGELPGAVFLLVLSPGAPPSPGRAPAPFYPVSCNISSDTARPPHRLRGRFLPDSPSPLAGVCVCMCVRVLSMLHVWCCCETRPRCWSGLS